MRGYDLTPFVRAALGFDGFDRGLPSVRRASAEATYPFYNLIKTDEGDYRLSLAVAGFAEDELDVTVDDGELVVTGRQAENSNGVTYLRRGFVPRDFERRFALAEDFEVKDARLENGVLHIELEHHVPEHRKPRRIAIGANAENHQAA